MLTLVPVAIYAVYKGYKNPECQSERGRRAGVMCRPWRKDCNSLSCGIGILALKVAWAETWNFRPFECCDTYVNKTYRDEKDLDSESDQLSHHRCGAMVYRCKTGALSRWVETLWLTNCMTSYECPPSDLSSHCIESGAQSCLLSS